MHSEILPPQGRFRLSVVAGLILAALCIVVAALEHTIERLDDANAALRVKLEVYEAMPPCPSPTALTSIISGSNLTTLGITSTGLTNLGGYFTATAPSGFTYLTNVQPPTP